MKRIIPCVIITLALMLAGSFLPLFGFIGLMLCPLPLSILGCLEGRRNMSIAELMIEATLFLAVSPSMAVYFLIGCAPLSAVVFMLSQEGFRETKKLTGGECYLICAGASVLFKTLLLLAFWFFTGRNILLPDAGQMRAVMSQLYGESPELVAALSRAIALLPHLLPSILVIYAGAEAFLNYSLCGRIMRKYFPSSKNFPPELPDFKLWKFPVSILIVSASVFILSWFLDDEADFAVVMFVANLQIAANVIMFVQGASLAFWIMDGFRLKRAVRVAVCVMMGIPFFWPWLIVMGMCEMALSMRDRIKFGGKD